MLVAQLHTYPDLPRTVDGLHHWLHRSEPHWIDAEGKLIWRDGVAAVAFGAQAGTSLADLAANDRGFLEWVLHKNFSDEVKAIVREALAGRFSRSKRDGVGLTVSVQWVAQSGRSSADVVAVPARAIVDLVLRGGSAGGDTALCVRLRPAGGCGAAPTSVIQASGMHPRRGSPRARVRPRRPPRRRVWRDHDPARPVVAPSSNCHRGALRPSQLSSSNEVVIDNGARHGTAGAARRRS